jgi:hypothetical protein
MPDGRLVTISNLFSSLKYFYGFHIKRSEKQKKSSNIFPIHLRPRDFVKLSCLHRERAEKHSRALPISFNTILPRDGEFYGFVSFCRQVFI